MTLLKFRTPHRAVFDAVDSEHARGLRKVGDAMHACDRARAARTLCMDTAEVAVQQMDATQECRLVFSKLKALQDVPLALPMSPEIAMGVERVHIVFEDALNCVSEDEAYGLVRFASDSIDARFIDPAVNFCYEEGDPQRGVVAKLLFASRLEELRKVVPVTFFDHLMGWYQTAAPTNVPTEVRVDEDDRALLERGFNDVDDPEARAMAELRRRCLLLASLSFDDADPDVELIIDAIIAKGWRGRRRGRGTIDYPYQDTYWSPDGYVFYNARDAARKLVLGLTVVREDPDPDADTMRMLFDGVVDLDGPVRAHRLVQGWYGTRVPKGDYTDSNGFYYFVVSPAGVVYVSMWCAVRAALCGSALDGRVQPEIYRKERPTKFARAETDLRRPVSEERRARACARFGSPDERAEKGAMALARALNARESREHAAKDVKKIIARDAPIRRTSKHRRTSSKPYVGDTATSACEYLGTRAASVRAASVWDLRHDILYGYVEVMDLGVDPRVRVWKSPDDEGFAPPREEPRSSREEIELGLDRLMDFCRWHGQRKRSRISPVPAAPPPPRPVALPEPDPSHRPCPPARLDDTSSDEAEESESEPEEDVVHYRPGDRVELVGDGLAASLKGATGRVLGTVGTPDSTGRIVPDSTGKDAGKIAVELAPGREVTVFADYLKVAAAAAMA